MKMHSQPACCIPPGGLVSLRTSSVPQRGVPDMISPWWPATCLLLFCSRWQDQSAEVATVSDYPLAGAQLERKTEGATRGPAEPDAAERTRTWDGREEWWWILERGRSC